MKKGNLDTLLSRPVSFLDNSGPNGDIAISTRIRIARNPAGYPFPCAASPEEQQKISGFLCDAIRDSKALDSDTDGQEFDFAALPLPDRQLLFERRLASSEFIHKNESAYLFVCPQERCSIMVNEEDHIRMQSIRPGFQLPGVYKEISAIDDALSEKIEFAFDDQLGYLTSCPSNVGTGMRASVMLHLPALVLTKQMEATCRGLGKLNLAVRGAFGEGSENTGNLFQISNQATLGESEEKIIAGLHSVIEHLIEQEKLTRKLLLENDRAGIYDFVGRSYGVLRHSYRLSEKEALASLSGVRLGVDLGMFKSLDTGKVNDLFVSVGTAHLERGFAACSEEKDTDVCRATYCREKIKQYL